MVYRKIITILSIFSLICLLSIFLIINITIAQINTCSANCGDNVVICGSETGTCYATDGVGCATVAGGQIVNVQEC